MPQVPSPASPTPEQVLAALDRTGFILEYRVAQLLREYTDEVYLNHIFPDPDTGKTREIDVYAAQSESIDSRVSTIWVRAILLIECKNYKDPVLVIGEGGQTRYRNGQPVISLDPLNFNFPSRAPGSYGGILRVTGIRSPAFVTDGFLGSQLIKMNRKGADWQATNGGVYDGIVYPLSKAIYDECRRIETTDSEADYRWAEVEIGYTYPILVTAGTVLAVDVSAGAPPTVTSVGWAPVVRNFADDTFMFDVVGFDSLNDYVRNRVFPLTAAAKELLRPKLGLFDPQWLNSEYGTPTDGDFSEWLEWSATYQRDDEALYAKVFGRHAGDAEDDVQEPAPESDEAVD